MLLDHLPAGSSATLAWGMLLHDIGKPATFTQRAGERIRFNGHVEVGMRIAEAICARLRFSNDDTAQIVELIRHHMQFGDIKQMKQSTLKRFLRLPQFEEHLALHFADCSSCHGKLGLYEFAKAAYEQEEPEHERARPLVTGTRFDRAGSQAGTSVQGDVAGRGGRSTRRENQFSRARDSLDRVGIWTTPSPRP